MIYVHAADCVGVEAEKSLARKGFVPCAEDFCRRVFPPNSRGRRRRHCCVNCRVRAYDHRTAERLPFTV